MSFLSLGDLFILNFMVKIEGNGRHFSKTDLQMKEG